MKRFGLLLVLGVALFLQVPTAHAEGFALTDFAARGTALAGGMIGRANDASAVAYNPAGITQLPGVQLMLGVSTNIPTGSIETRDAAGNITTTDAEKKIWLAPNMYATFQLNDFAWLGLGVFSRFGLGVEYPSDWPGRFGVADVALQTVSFNPNIAVKLSDKLSFAVGLDFMYGTMELNNNINLAGGIAIHLEGDGTAVGFNAALHYIFNDQWQAGLSYRSAMTLGVNGDATFSREVPVRLVNGGVNGDLELPDSLAFGLNYTPSDVWNFEAGFLYTLWSKYTDLDMELASGTLLLSPKDWKDTWLFNISAEYQVLDWLALRGGYSFETNAVTSTYADFMTPSHGRHRVHTGAGFAWDSWTLDVTYSYIFVKDLDYTNSQATGVRGIGVTSKDTGAHVVSLAVSYAF